MITARIDKTNDYENKSKKLDNENSIGNNAKLSKDPFVYKDNSKAIIDVVSRENTIESDIIGQNCRDYNNVMLEKCSADTYDLKICTNCALIQHSSFKKTKLLGFEQNNTFHRTNDKQSDEKTLQNIISVPSFENDIASSQILSVNSSLIFPIDTELTGLAFLLQESNVLIFTICIKAPVTLALTMSENNYFISIDIFASQNGDLQIYMPQNTNISELDLRNCIDCRILRGSCVSFCLEPCLATVYKLILHTEIGYHQVYVRGMSTGMKQRD